MKETTTARAPYTANADYTATQAISPAPYQGDPLADLLKLTGNRTPEKTAAKLREVFGSAADVIKADPDAIAKATTKATAEKIAAVLPILRGLMKAESEEKQRIRNSSELETFCKSLLYGKRVEEFHVICVNAQCQIIGTRCIATGSLNEVAAYPRLIAEAALNMNAHCVFLTHNHPGGTFAPSMEDIKSTERIQELLCLMDIRVLDHMIIAGNNGYSMMQHGDINFR